MANKNIHVNITASDLASKVFAGVKSSASSMASHLTQTLESSVKFEKSIKQYNNSMYHFNRVVSNVARTAGDSIYNFTRDAINNFSELERQHAKTMGAMATDYAKTTEAQAKFLNDSEKLKQQAIQIGTYGVNGKGALNTITDVSYAQTALIKSGMSADNLLNSDVVESVLKFAGGNDLDVDTATQFAVNLGTIFDKPVEEWSKMLDMVTKAADISVIDVEDIMDSLTYTGGIASGLGRDLEEVLGVISVMGQAGLRGRVAGTGLQAFFTRILSAGELTDTQIGNAPTDYVGQIYNAFTAEAVNADGSFKNMDEVSELLNTAMSSLNDQEQAWFAKKLFGLYQMKAAYALTGAVDGDSNLITDFINQIENESAGSNDIKYELMQASQYGKITSLQYAWEGIKTDVGDKLSPVVSTVADELLAFLSHNGNYKINWDKLRDAINESGGLIGEKYGEQLGQAVANLGNLGVDAGIIANAMIPYAGGLINGLALLLQGDISGALSAFKDGLDETNENIDDLPPELQGSAEAARNLITAFTTLAGINLTTQIVQILTTAFNTFLAKPIKWLTSKISSSTTTVQSPTTNIANAATVNIGNVPLMNVTATVVNVYGGFNPFGGGGGGGALPWLLGGGAGGALLGSGSSNIAGLLGAGASTGAGMAGAGKLVTLYKVGGQYVTAGQAMKMIGSTALKGAGIVGVLATAMSMSGSSTNEGTVFQDNLQRGLNEGLTGEELRKYLMDNQYGASDHMTDPNKYTDADRDTREKQYANDMYDALLEASAYFGTQEGLTDVLNKLVEHYESGGDFNEEYFHELFSYTASNGTTFEGSQKLATEVLNTLFGDKFDASWIYAGSYNDSKMDDFIRGQIDSKNFGDLSSLPSVLAQYESITVAEDIVSSLTEMADKIQSPVVNVNVTTNVDKSGNATTKVDINNASRNLVRRASQYGQVAMMN